jgi:glycine betaine/choline ABC-type transport system substrate-binding protein
MKKLLWAACLSLAACRGDERPLVIGSKNFSEQIILAEIFAELLEARGVPVERKLNLEGTFICHQALLAGDLDLYVEYTGTALAAILKLPFTSDREEAFRLVKEEYDKRFGLDWGPRLGFNNTFALLMRSDHAAELGIRTISDLRPHTGALRTGFGYEFLEREDGLPGLVRAYGLEFKIRPREMTLSLIYQALSEKQVDLVAGNQTDGLIEALELMVLEDDRAFFPPYDAAPVIRREALAREPLLGEVLQALAGRVDVDTMRELNRAVDSDKRPARVVAREWVAATFGTP